MNIELRKLLDAYADEIERLDRTTMDRKDRWETREAIMHLYSIRFEEWSKEMCEIEYYD